MSSSLSVERPPGVFLLRLNRPPSNTLNLELLGELKKGLAAAAGDPEVRALVLTSGLPKYFSSGLDLDELLGLPESERARLFESMVEVHRALAAFPKPTIAALAGSALLGGFILTLACDYRLIGAGAKLALNEIRLGLSPTTALVRLLSRLSGSQTLVKAMILEGKPAQAEEALQAGLVDAVHPCEQVEAEALRLAERLGRQAPAAYAAVKRGYRRALMGDEDALWKSSMLEFERIFESEEAREGLAASRDKRRPQWNKAGAP